MRCPADLEFLSTPGVGPCSPGPTYCITRENLSASRLQSTTIHFRLTTSWFEIVNSLTLNK